MSELHDLCKFPIRPIDQSYIEKLTQYLKDGIPATYTIEEAYNYINNINIEPTTTTTPLHLICQNAPIDITNDEQKIISQMVEKLFEYGAGWSFTDINNQTPGCILISRRQKIGNEKWMNDVYQQIIDAGVRAELLLRKVNEFEEVEFIDEEEEEEEEEIPQLVEDQQETKEEQQLQQQSGDIDDAPDAPSQNQQSYLNTKLEYINDALITKNDKDGVMMAWENDIMKLASDTITSNLDSDDNHDSELNILNIGFGMGIIDNMIQSKLKDHPNAKHYICEAHPDVLEKMKLDGWYNKSNVIILEGRWQDKLNELLSSSEQKVPVFFDGIYYDTFSEHYQDMLELFDIIVGLLKPNGIFSFFNGLGADRQIIYQVYKNLLIIDLENYGLNCQFKEIEIPIEKFWNESKDKSIWDDVKRSYWSCPIYYHPIIKFIDDI
ncbi:arginine N-methyltransferase, putative [Candida dubliniensis CD36]|uniref:Arginine N-methyltransferase 2 n=1 Tax=Candida dubliniensis (strain CD36 / ATCC MYA-646 / CBS 7987 / NCPF 3949 / NRRL Y-17841) TaxID=573826 RepID=B9WH09_CANDC|nr:arginine N-methyltransferase, putative [Candida dubliniensis CD36]CAX41450.1 arginine N-methyltransferase, putative [Candida dubliniensis CD36]